MSDRSGDCGNLEVYGAYSMMRAAFEAAARGGHPLLGELTKDFIATTDFCWRRGAMPQLARAVVGFDPLGRIDAVSRQLGPADLDSMEICDTLNIVAEDQLDRINLVAQRGFRRR